MDSYYLGVDVGTGSVRVGVFNANGKLLYSNSKDIKINNPSPGYYEQSSEDIWSGVVQLIKEVVTSRIVEKERIRGIAFCATCSLVAVGPSNGVEKISISENGDEEWNIIMWLDHRAGDEANFINEKGHRVLDFVGGKISLEMQTPKILWLKRHLPQSYERTDQFFDLPDYLRWRATGSLKRSICSVVCKWTAVNTPKDGCAWDSTFFKSVGLEDALLKIGSNFSYPGDCDPLGAEAAKEMGLEGIDVNVGYSQIDAHSGVLGMMGCTVVGEERNELDVTKRLALICGTSNCHMALSREACLVPGVWGPYYGVILPDFNLNEGGQSAAGKLLDHIVSCHPAYSRMMKEYKNHGKVLVGLESFLTLGESKATTELTKELHIYPDFHGNRSPLADPTLKGMMSGLTLSDSEEDLAILYLATIQALAYGSLHIMRELEKNGHTFDSVVICGGLTKSRLFLQSHADILQLPVLVPHCAEPVLLGAAISAAAATPSKTLDLTRVVSMSGGAELISPNRNVFAYHEKKFAVFLEMYKDQTKYRELMKI